MKTIVYQLGTNNEYIYTLPPKIAVVNAYYQYAKTISITARTVYCGNFAAKAE